VVAFLWARSCCRAQSQHTNTTLPNSQPKMATAIFGFGLTHAPKMALVVDRKNTVFGKLSGKAATSCNERFRKIAAVRSFEKVYYFCRWLLVGKCVGSRNLAKPPGRYLSCEDRGVATETDSK
jgi:hypothetical protein